MRSELREEVVSVVVQVSEKILGEKVDSKKDQDLIKNTVKSLS